MNVLWAPVHNSECHNVKSYQIASIKNNNWQDNDGHNKKSGIQNSHWHHIEEVKTAGVTIKRHS